MKLQMSYITLNIIIISLYWLSVQQGLYSRLNNIEHRLNELAKLEQEVKEAKWQAVWATTLIDDNMKEIGREIRRINKGLDMPLWGWDNNL